MTTYSLTYYKGETKYQSSDMGMLVSKDRNVIIQALADKMSENDGWYIQEDEREWKYCICVNGAMYISTFGNVIKFDDTSSDPHMNAEEAEALMIENAAKDDAILRLRQAADAEWFDQQSTKDPKPGPGRSFWPVFPR